MWLFRNIARIRGLGKSVSNEPDREIRVIKTSENSWTLVWADEVTM
ncbi:MAG: hypothetical protein ACRDF4_03735 [Rhabdochlamydiaceae bacterium]